MSGAPFHAAEETPSHCSFGEELPAVSSVCMCYRLAALLNYMLRIEREWCAVMEGAWAASDCEKHRQEWNIRVSCARQVSPLCSGRLLSSETCNRG